jgi:hypothetical protein
MSISVDEMVEELRDTCGVDEDDLPEAKAILFLNKAWWEILNKFPFREKEMNYDFTTTIGERSYDVPSLFEAIRAISIQNPDTGLHTTLRRMDPRHYEDIYVDNVDAYAYPTNYYRENDQIVVYPTPDLEYSMLVKYWINLSDLEAGDTPIIPTEWHEIIQLGAEWRTWRFFRQYKSARDAKANQIALINSTVPVEAKEEGDSRLAGLSVVGYDRRRLWR